MKWGKIIGKQLQNEIPKARMLVYRFATVILDKTFECVTLGSKKKAQVPVPGKNVPGKKV